MSWIRVIGPLPITPVCHFSQFCDGFGEVVNHSTRCGWWIALTSSIWQHRNQLIFQGKPFDPYKVMDHAIFLAWSWLKANDRDFNTSFNHWSSNITNFVAQTGLGLYILVVLLWIVILEGSTLVPCNFYPWYHWYWIYILIIYIFSAFQKKKNKPCSKITRPVVIRSCKILLQTSKPCPEQESCIIHHFVAIYSLTVTVFLANFKFNSVRNQQAYW